MAKISHLPSATAGVTRRTAFEILAGFLIPLITGLHKGDPGGAEKVYHSITALALAGDRATDRDYAKLNYLGRETRWIFSTGDLSALVAIDTARAIHVPRAGDASGATGTWLQKGESDIRQMIGGDGDIASTIATLRANGSKRAYLSAGSYTMGFGVDIGDMEIEGDGDATVIAPGDHFSGLHMLQSMGSYTRLPGLNADVTKGARTISVDTIPALNPNEIFVIYNPTDGSYNEARTYYREGEYCEVQSVDGNKITLKKGLYSGYLAANVELHKINTNSPKIKNIRFETGAFNAFQFSKCRDVFVENVTGGGSGDQSVYIDRCYGVKIDNFSFHNAGAGSGSDYALSIGNSQHVRINGGDIYSRRHPVAMGGGDFTGCVPVRDVQVTGAVLQNDQSTNVYCADFHGNVEESKYVGCEIHGGGGWGGKNNGYEDCTIFNDGIGTCIYSSEIKGGLFTADNCTFSTDIDPGARSRGIIDIGGNSAAISRDVTEDCIFKISHCHLKCENLQPQTSFLKMVNSGTNYKVNIEVKGLSIETANPIEIIRTDIDDAVDKPGSANSDFMIVTDIRGAPEGSRYAVHISGHYLDVPHRS